MRVSQRCFQVVCFVLAFCTSIACAQKLETVASKIRPPQRTGFFAGIDIRSVGDIEWTYKAKAGVGQPTVANGMVYFVDQSNVVHAKSAKGGLSVWKKDIKQTSYRTPVANREHVFVGTKFGVLALASGSGDVAWNYPIDGGAGEMVLWPETKSLYVAGTDGFLRALDATNGDEKWKTSLMKEVPPDPEGFEADFGGPCRPSGIATDGQLVYQNIFDQSRCVALNARTGELKWSYQTGGWIGGTPSVDEKLCYIGSQDRHLHAVDKKTGKLVWKFATGSRVSEGPALHKQYAVFGSCDGGVYCVHRKTGEKIWAVVTDPDSTGRRFIYSKPIINDEAVCIACGEGQVYSLSLDTGAILWKQRPMPISQCYCSPTTDGVRIFVCTRPDWDDNGEAGIVALGPVDKSS